MNDFYEIVKTVADYTVKKENFMEAMSLIYERRSDEVEYFDGDEWKDLGKKPYSCNMCGNITNTDYQYRPKNSRWRSDAIGGPRG